MEVFCDAVTPITTKRPSRSCTLPAGSVRGGRPNGVRRVVGGIQAAVGIVHEREDVHVGE
jgi:hypothetical protein